MAKIQQITNELENWKFYFHFWNIVLYAWSWWCFRIQRLSKSKLFYPFRWPTRICIKGSSRNKIRYIFRWRKSSFCDRSIDKFFRLIKNNVEFHGHIVIFKKLIRWRFALYSWNPKINLKASEKNVLKNIHIGSKVF